MLDLYSKYRSGSSLLINNSTLFRLLNTKTTNAKPAQRKKFFDKHSNITPKKSFTHVNKEKRSMKQLVAKRSLSDKAGKVHIDKCNIKPVSYTHLTLPTNREE
eukprot:TRINITY_DN24722_c0_g1_i1.p2 TRINITY_DN24722_c0_g1~~TRINITY_DN24722_c0_g1_i1.p2  ORF type:complete len:103 (-),score=14.29 TRINITY_DN24722_c0_g1_i1:37-345(-)